MNFRTVVRGIANMVDDRRILKRIRAELGRLSSHPQAIDVQTHQGAVTLRGTVLNSEVADILSGVESLRGVRSVRSPSNVACTRHASYGRRRLRRRNFICSRAGDARR